MQRTLFCSVIDTIAMQNHYISYYHTTGRIESLALTSIPLSPNYYNSSSYPKNLMRERDILATESGEKKVSKTLIDHISSTNPKHILVADVIRTGMVDHYLVYGIGK